MRYRNVAQTFAVGLALSGAITACGSSGSGASAAAQIKANWETFFNAKTPVAKRVSLLENGRAFEAFIKAQAKSPLASSASVSKVTGITGAQAKVMYTLMAAGSPVLKNQTGTAVNYSGIWQVGDTSFCNLLALDHRSPPTKLPSACKP
jgi:hypothetical protein